MKSGNFSICSNGIIWKLQDIYIYIFKILRATWISLKSGEEGIILYINVCYCDFEAWLTIQISFWRFCSKTKNGLLTRVVAIAQKHILTAEKPLLPATQGPACAISAPNVTRMEATGTCSASLRSCACLGQSSVISLPYFNQLHVFSYPKTAAKKDVAFCSSVVTTLGLPRRDLNLVWSGISPGPGVATGREAPRLGRRKSGTTFGFFLCVYFKKKLPPTNASCKRTDTF